MSIQENKKLGLGFEKEIAADLGMELVPGSGSGPWAKLDLSGFVARMSLKFTRLKSVPITTNEIDEAVMACEGPGGTGEMPLWAFRLLADPQYDMIMMRLGDFKRMTEEKLVLSRQTKAEARIEQSRKPFALREEEER